MLTNLLAVVPPRGFQMGSVFVGYYAIIICIAIIVAYFLTSSFAKHREISKKHVFWFALILVPIAIFGARVVHVILNANDYTFVEAIAFWKGWHGIAIQGAVIFGAITLYVCCHVKKISYLKLLDILVPALILAQAIGRWGNFFNSELFGWQVANHAFPFTVVNPDTLQPHLALFFLESMANLAGFFVLWRMLKKVKSPGTVTGTYLLWYGTTRLILEPFRMPQFQPAGFNAFYLFSAMMVVAGICIILYNHLYKVRITKLGKTTGYQLWQILVAALLFPVGLLILLLPKKTFSAVEGEEPRSTDTLALKEIAGTETKAETNEQDKGDKKDGDI